MDLVTAMEIDLGRKAGIAVKTAREDGGICGEGMHKKKGGVIEYKQILITLPINHLQYLLFVLVGCLTFTGLF